MLMAFERLCFICLLANPTAVELSTCMGVADWVCPIYLSVTRMGHASQAAVKEAPISASMAELMMLFIIFAWTWTGPLGLGVLCGAVFVLRGVFMGGLVSH